MNSFKEYCKKYGIRVAFATVIVAMLFGISGGGNGEVSFAENAAMSMTVPGRSAATGFIGWLENIYGYMFRYDSLKEENERLQNRVTELENEMRKAGEAESENKNYRELLGMRDKYSDFVFEAAKIIDRGTSNWNSTLTIGKGNESGIEAGDCVVDSAYNIVGQVSEVGDGWSTIRTVIDTDINIGALVGDTGSAAMVVGDYALMRQGLVKLTYLTSGAQVFEGDVLQASGKGGSFPRGLVIGTVVNVYTEAGGQIDSAAVKPACNPDSLTQIFVVKDFKVVE